MVAKITVPATVRRALNYNEQKLKDGVAQCIYAHHFLKEAGHLNFTEKLMRFEGLISLNKRATTNAVHISLNFGLDEKLERHKLSEIASVYMHKIGFGEQPYLVYQHLDAGHPHIHIVTTNIQSGGKRISLHNIGRNQSNQARKEIEILYKLMKAEDQNKNLSEEIKPLHSQKITYGKSPTKRAIINVLDAVLPKYKYASLAELNAVLKLYNLTADRGTENGIIYKKQGLIYRVLNEQGNKIGVPVKASSIYNKPTLSFLKKKFEENNLLKQAYKKNLKTSIDWILLKPPKNVEAFKEALQREKIALVIRQNDQGIIYGMTYIDHNTKCVFNGSEIGKNYSANSILQRCGITQSFNADSRVSQLKQVSETEIIKNDLRKQPELNEGLWKIINGITKPIEQYTNPPHELKHKRKRKPQ